MRHLAIEDGSLARRPDSQIIDFSIHQQQQQQQLYFYISF